MEEDVLGAAKDGSDLAQDVAVDVLGAAKNGSVKVLIVKVFILSIVKEEAPVNPSAATGRWRWTR